MRIVAVDPGYEGGIAVLNTVTGKAFAYDVPVSRTRSNGKYRKRYLRRAMLRMLRKAAGKVWKDNTIVIIEEQHIFGREGRKSAFSLGVGYGQWLMAVDACELPCIAVNIIKWKNAMRLSSDKEVSRLKAIQLFPDLAHKLRLKRSHGKAEALLLALYYRDFILPKRLKRNKNIA